MKIPGNIITLIAGILLTLISLWYGQNHGLMPIAASQGAEEIDGLFDLMMTIATGLFLIVEGVLVYCVFKFRRKKGDQSDGPPVEGNVPLEIVWTAIPTIIVFVLAIYSFEVYNNLGGLDPNTSRDFAEEQIAGENGEMVALNPNQRNIALGIGNSSAEGEKQPLVVNIQGVQYAWIFNYENSGVYSAELHVPVNQPVELKMTATDVIHAFWVPELRLKQDVIPGRDAELIFTANRLGEYPIICAELCGAYHGSMKTVLKVESEEDYQQWIQDNTFANNNSVDDMVALMKTDQDPLTHFAHKLGVDHNILKQLPHQHLE